MRQEILFKIPIPIQGAVTSNPLSKSDCMKLFYFFLLFASFGQSCRAQHESWNSTKNWRIYKGEGQQIFSYTVDTLNSIKSNPLNQDSIQFFLKNMTPLADKTDPIWMGSYLASYESADGKIHKVEVSIYGGFLFDELTSKHYNLPRELNSRWLKFITENMPN